MPSSSINGAISLTDRALIDDGHYLQQLLIISLVIRTHFGPNPATGAGKPFSVLLIVTAALI